MTREEFLSDVRRRLRTTRAEARPERKVELAYSPPSAQLAITFAAALRRIGGHAYRAANSEEARARLGLILHESDTHRVVWADAPAIRDLNIELIGGQVEFVRVLAGDDSLRGLVQVGDAALTGAEYGIAATGSLVMVTGADQPRMLSALPATHIAILKTGQLVPTFEDLVPFVREAVHRVSNITLVTGPSRTGDIEQTITIGAHGPRNVHVILVD